MKKLIHLLAAMLFTQALSAQMHPVKDTLPRYELPSLLPGVRTVQIPVHFDRAQLLKEVPPETASGIIQRIDLVYTLNPTNPRFDQERLNRQRFTNLLHAFPQANNPLIEWHLVAQSGAKNTSEAQALFHGFTIYFRMEPTAESMKTEMDYLDECLGLKAPLSFTMRKESEPDGIADVRALKESSVEKRAVLFKADPEFFVLRKADLETPCYTMQTGKRTLSEANFKKLEDSIMRLPGITHLSWTTQTNKTGKNKYTYAYYLRNADCSDFLPVSFSWFQSADADAVRETFLRHPDWQKTLVVMDVTGSMSPYIGKTMAWVKATQDSSQVFAFVYFNDGDMKSTADKVDGNVGGVYSVRNTDFNAVYGQLKETMRRGGGGDAPENNVEAMLKGSAQFPDCEEIVMVADNWASPRDLEFVFKLERPVHIIVCGSSGGVNIDYIQLAYETGGSVHTIEEDLELRNIEPGRQFRIGQQYFTLINGKIVRAENRY